MKTGLIHHIEIYVSNLERSKTFWSWFLSLLSYEVYQEWDAGISYKLADSYLVFVQAEDHYLEVGYHRKRVGLNHLAFYADSQKKVDQVYHLLKLKGITTLYDQRYPFAAGKDYYAVFFEDPDRIKVELTAS